MDKVHWARWILDNVIGAVMWVIVLMLIALIVMVCVVKFKELIDRY